MNLLIAYFPIESEMKRLPGVDFAAPVAGPREFGLATRNSFNRGGFKPGLPCTG